MPHRAEQSLLVVLLLLASSPAMAHGLEGVVQPLVFAAVAVGLIAGVLTGVTGTHPGAGLLSSLGVMLAGVLAFVLVETPASSDLLGIIGMMLILTAFAGAIPLVITFFVAFAGAAVVRARFWPEEKKGEPAP